MNISVIIPAYNSEQSLEPLIGRLRTVLDSCAESYEVIIVNDDSSDGTWRVMEGLAARHTFIRAINLMRNYGQHNALLCGIRMAQHEFIITMDDDLQHPPEEITKLIAKINEGFDVVYGTPIKEQHGIGRDLASRITKLTLGHAMGAEIASNISAFRIFRTQLRDAFLHYRGSFVSIDVLLTWATKRFAALPVNHEPRKLGKSNYTFRKLMTHALNMMTGFSVLPLQIASFMGFFLTLFGFGALVYTIINFFVRGAVVPGFAFLSSIISIFSGSQLFALGIIGEYLARMHFRMMDRPPYTVREETCAVKGK